MPTITEPAETHKDRLAFTFPDDWYALRYDDKGAASFYKNRVEVFDGLKGVDLLAGRHPDFPALLLLEIKDYRRRAAKLRQKLQSGKLQREVQQKVLNTWAGLHLGARAHDELLDEALRSAVLRPVEQLDFVFFLAQDPITPSPRETDTRKAMHNRRDQRQLIEKKMREKLSPLGIRCRLADVDDLPRGSAWRVEALPAQRS
jgi:hypothetical protein